MRASVGFVIPVTIDDLAANDLLGEAHPQVCWERSVETLTARKDDIAGLAVASDERIEAYVLYVKGGRDATEILSLRSFIEDGGARLRQLLSQLRARRHEDLPVPEGPPGGDLEGVPGDARFPPRRRTSTLRSEGAVRLGQSHRGSRSGDGVTSAISRRSERSNMKVPKGTTDDTNAINQRRGGQRRSRPARNRTAMNIKKEPAMHASHDADRERETRQILERHRDEKQDQEGRAFKERDEPELAERRHDA